LRQGLQLALWGGLGMGIQADGLAYTEASTSAFLTQAYCVLLPLWAALQTRCRPSPRIVGATVFVLIGGAVLSGVRPGSLKIGRGETETLVAAVFFALQILTLENPRYAANRGRPVTLVMCAGIALLYVPVTLVASPAPGAPASPYSARWARSCS
jgi:drug/metabolite transporter (DMT)-like permease